LPPAELIVIDGAPLHEMDTEERVRRTSDGLPFQLRYLRYGGGTAVQRNAGIDAATGQFIAFIDDDIRLQPDFLEKVVALFGADTNRTIGGITGYRTTDHFRAEESERWRWYRRLRLLRTFEPGRYDFQTGYPVNANMQPPFTGVRSVDFMSTSCAVWRRQVIDAGLRFDPFFKDFGVLEDAHFSLRAGRRWRLLQCGDARCEHLHAPGGRVDSRRLGYKAVVNYYYVFRDICAPLSPAQQFRFWRFQAFEIFRIATSAVRRWRWADVMELRGRLAGMSTLVRARFAGGIPFGS